MPSDDTYDVTDINSYHHHNIANFNVDIHNDVDRYYKWHYNDNAYFINSNHHRDFHSHNVRDNHNYCDRNCNKHTNNNNYTNIHHANIHHANNHRDYFGHHVVYCNYHGNYVSHDYSEAMLLVHFAARRGNRREHGYPSSIFNCPEQ
jgi:viroplasmin and RNaseH domain-containing protein